MKVVSCLLLVVVAVYAAPSKRQICGPVCMIYCPYGHVLDDDGCPTCQCIWQINPAKRQQLLHCNLGFMALCDLWCPSGKMAHDANGCPLCQCDNSGLLQIQ